MELRPRYRTAQRSGASHPWRPLLSNICLPMEQPGPNVDGPLMGVRPGEAGMCRISLTRPRLPPAAYKGQRPFFAKGEVQVLGDGDLRRVLCLGAPAQIGAQGSLLDQRGEHIQPEHGACPDRRHLAPFRTHAVRVLLHVVRRSNHQG